MVGTSPLYNLVGLNFRNFPKKEGSSDFSHKKGWIVKIGGCTKKEGITFFTLTLSNVIFLSVRGLCMCPLVICMVFISFPVFHRQDLYYGM